MTVLVLVVLLRRVKKCILRGFWHEGMNVGGCEGMNVGRHKCMNVGRHECRKV